MQRFPTLLAVDGQACILYVLYNLEISEQFRSQMIVHCMLNSHQKAFATRIDKKEPNFNSFGGPTSYLPKMKP